MSTSTKPVTRYRVTGAYVTVRTSGSLMPTLRGTPAAWMVCGCYRDALLPENAHPEDVNKLLARRLIEEVQVNA